MKQISFRHHGRVIRGDISYPPGVRAPYPAVIIVHGRGSNRTKMVGGDSLRTKLLQQGSVVMRIDLFGHGQSDGDFADLTVTKAGHDVKAAYTYLHQRSDISRFGISAIGHSMGGTAILLARAADAMFKTITLIAPVGDTQYHVHWRHEAAMLAAWRKTGWHHWTSSVTGRVRSLRYSFHRDLATIDTLALSKNNHQPILIVHGTADRNVPLVESQRLMKVLHQPKELFVVPGADHNFTKPKDKRAMVTKVISWLKTFHGDRIGRSVTMIIQHGDQVLTLKRSNEVLYYPNTWAVVGGHLPPGIDPVKHAFVELREEVGFTHSDVRLKRVGKKVRITDPNSGRTWISVPVLVELKKKKAPRLDWEHSTYRWVPVSKFPFKQSYYGARMHFKAVGLV